jgi:YbgC/YbaW family acyl-CoA thioester hydrolase
MPFSLIHRVQFSETDAAGIVHFSNYFRWMEEVEHAFFRSVGLSVQMKHEGREIGWPRVSVGCEYEGPARFEDEVELRFTINKIGGKSLSYRVEFINAGRRIATGHATSACCELGTEGMKAVSIPDIIRSKLSAGLDDRRPEPATGSPAR